MPDESRESVIAATIPGAPKLALCIGLGLSTSAATVTTATTDLSPFM